jgi:hypothetical protein
MYVHMTVWLLGSFSIFALRDDSAYFFQAGEANAGTWWFTGSADLCRPAGMSPNEFMRDFSVFLAAFDDGLSEHRRQHRRHAASAQTSYLESCLVRGMQFPWGGEQGVPGTTGDTSGACGGGSISSAAGPAAAGGTAHGSSSSSSSPTTPPPLPVPAPGLDQTTGFAFMSSVVERMT